MEELLVLSASRRTDLVGCYPDVLMSRLKEYPPESVHSVVLWTKNPRNLLAEGELKNLLRTYRQLYIHLTITGMGGGEFEPMIPPWEETVEMIGPLIALTGTPRRISWRFDPILEVEGSRGSFSNFPLFPRLASAVARWGVETCRVSWVSPYRKVVARLARKDWHLVEADGTRRESQAEELQRTASRLGLRIRFCSMPGFPVTRCIDGGALKEMHPLGRECSQKKARGQRQLCGCTESLDIGWYSLRCRHGCVYCYATP